MSVSSRPTGSPSTGSPSTNSPGRAATGRAARHLLVDLDHLPQRITEIVTTTEGISQFGRGLFRVAVVADPTLARAVLARSSGTSPGRGVRALRLILGQGLLTSEGDLHRRQRRLVQPAFHPRRLARYAHDAVRAARERSASWQPGGRVDLAAEMSSLTLDVVGRTLFGTDLREDAVEVAEAQTSLLAVFPRLMTPAGMLAARLPTPLRHRIRSATARLDAVVDRVVAARRLTGDTGDVLSILLAARDEETGAGMPPEQVRDEVLTLVLAGHETTAVALSWTWWELGRHPQVRAELDRELALESTRQALREAAWDRLPYSRAVIAETLRLHPPAYLTARLTTDDLDLGGERIRRGTGVLICPYALHRDPRWWADPSDWRPARWLDGSGRFDEANPGQPRGAYLPFGAGPRICIGAGFATMEAVLLLATLASAWCPRIDPGHDPGEQPAVTLRPRHGMPAVLFPADRPGGATAPPPG